MGEAGRFCVLAEREWVMEGVFRTGASGGRPRLLLGEFHHLGDGVMALPFVLAAMEKYEVFVVCPFGVDEVFRLVLPEERVFRWNSFWRERGQGQSLGGVFFDFFRLVKWARGMSFDIGVYCLPDPRLAFLYKVLGVKKIVAFSVLEENWYARHLSWRRRHFLFARVAEKLGGGLRKGDDQALVKRSGRQHHAENWTQIAGVLGFEVPDDAGLFADEKKNAERARFDRREKKGKIRVGFHAGGRFPSKRWPVEKWVELLERSRATGKVEVVALAGGTDEEFLVEEGCDESFRLGTVRELFDVLGGLDLLVCHDSFPAHLGAAIGVSVVAIFGSGNPEWFAPGRNLGSVISDASCPTKPCFDRCVQKSYLCLERISVDDVWKRMLDLQPDLA